MQRTLENRKTLVNNIKLQLYTQFTHPEIVDTPEFKKLLLILNLFQDYGKERDEKINFEFGGNTGYIDIHLKNNVNISPNIKIHINKIKK